MFHHIFIVEKTGICIFHKCFDEIHQEDVINQDLFSGFFTALFDFSKEMFSKDFYDFIDLIDFGEKRFLIVEARDYFFIGLIDANMSTIAGYKQLHRFKNSFLYKFRKTLENWRGQLDEFEGVDRILSKAQQVDKLNYLNPKLTAELNKLLLDFTIENNEVQACCLLSMIGVPQIDINMTKELSTTIIKEIELRWRARIENVDKVIFSFANNDLIIMQNVKDKFILAGIFKKGVSLGMADMHMEDMIEKISKLDMRKT